MTEKTNSPDLFPTPHVPVAWGEVIDKITILEIKADKLTDAVALANVKKELSLLVSAAALPLSRIDSLIYLKERLRSVNLSLWKIEDDIREKERKQEFDSCFIELARSVYHRNDDRAKIKKEISFLLGSEIVEEKNYKSY